jgi:selenocysteine-specific elongation factor
MRWRPTTSPRIDVTGALRVVATAGHVDHGKSALIDRLTGIDPDRWEEEKRRGLTIDLGYAWCTLPSDREIGFVDVPGHERFVRNMLAGVGPVRVVLFVVAADEGWKPQSEEHLQILDVLGIAGGVIALTKRDLVDDETLAIALDEVRERIAGTVLERAAIVPVSVKTGEGLEELTAALDSMLAAAPPPDDARVRLFVDRVFTIKGAGTVLTGTLAGGCLAVGDEVQIYPTGHRVRIRGLQTHKETEQRACPVTRVAANVVGAEREDLARGDVLGMPDAWRPTTRFDGVLRSVRTLEYPVTERGAYTVHAGASEAEARIRLEAPLRPGSGSVRVRVRTRRPLVLDIGDRFVLREEGRRETVGGGVVLDVDPPRRFADARHLAELDARLDADRGRVAASIVEDRGAVRASDLRVWVAAEPHEDLRAGEWVVAGSVRAAVREAITAFLTHHHRAHPLEEGAPLDRVRESAARAARAAGAAADPELAEALLVDLASSGALVRTAATVRLPTHRVALEERTPDVDRLLAAIGGERESRPPTINELVARGIAPELIEAAARAGSVVRIAPDLVVAPSLIERALELVRAHSAEGIAVSQIREALGTSRKYAVPLAEWLDRSGRTVRRGDLRFLRD